MPTDEPCLIPREAESLHGAVSLVAHSVPQAGDAQREEVVVASPYCGHSAWAVSLAPALWEGRQD